MTSVPAGFEDWIGRTRERDDVVTERLAASFQAIFDPYLAPQRDGVAPLGVHWCLSPEIAATAALGQDGHPAKSRFLPPVPLPRRMWAGGTLETRDAIRIGDRVRRVSTISEITMKEGRTGPLWFVSVNHVHSTLRGLAIREQQTLVFREAAGVDIAPAPKPATASPKPCGDHSTMTPTPPLLFRYSAITFNGHRIHYDAPYARGVESYAGLVVHGPLQATLLLNLAAKVLATDRLHMDYRGLAPAISGDALKICAGIGDQSGQFWTEGPLGQTHMAASMTPGQI